jgi:hypothetical protein
MSNISVYNDANSFEHAQRVAKSLSVTTMVPRDYQGNIANCLVALETAQRLNMSPLMVMQNLHVIHGRPSWSAAFLISAINQSGRYSPLKYEQTPDSCRAYATDLSTGEIVKGPAATIEMAKAEGWYNKAGSKWKTMPELMLMYRAAAFFARLYTPDLTMGFKTAEENLDAGVQVQRPRTTAVDINSRIFDAEAEVVPEDAVQDAPAEEAPANDTTANDSEPTANDTDPFGFLTED